MGASMTKKELATVAGYTYRRVYDIDRDLPQDKKLFVEGENGKYDLAVFVQRWVAYNVDNEMPETADLETVKARHEVVKTQKTELEVARMRGQLIDVQDAKRLWGDIANTVMQNLIHVPSKVAPMLRMMDNVEIITEIISAEIRKALEAVAETPLPTYASEESESEEENDEEG